MATGKSEENKNRAKKLLPMIVMLLLIISSVLTVSILFPTAKAIPFNPFEPFPQGGGQVNAPEAWNIEGYSNINFYGTTNIKGLQRFGYYNTSWGDVGNYTEINPRNLNYGNWLWFRGSQYNHSQEIGQIIPTYPNITITKVYAMITYPDHLKEGWFSVKLGSESWTTAAPWLSGSMTYSHLGVGVNTSYLFNSTLYPHQIVGGFPYHVGVNYWDITSITNWTLNKTTSPYTSVMWTTIENTTIAGHDYVDYIGLYWEYYAAFNYTGGIGDNLIPDFTNNFATILWLLIVFAPALALQFMLPKIGYAFGMFLSLFIFGITQPNFMYVTIIGISALGVMLYKGD